MLLLPPCFVLHPNIWGFFNCALVKLKCFYQKKLCCIALAQNIYSDILKRIWCWLKSTPTEASEIYCELWSMF